MEKKSISSPGFTLLEIMVALLLTGVIFSILFGVYGQTLDVAESVERGQRSMRILRLGTERIRLDLQGLIPAPEKKKDENATQEEVPPVPPFLVREFDDLDLDDPVFMEFCTVNRLAFSDTFPARDPVMVSYLVQDGTLIRRQVPFPGLAGEWSAQEVELFGEIRELELSCVGPDEEVFSSWPPEGEDIPPVPGLIRFSCTLEKEEHSAQRVAFTIRPRWWEGQSEKKPGKK